MKFILFFLFLNILDTAPGQAQNVKAHNAEQNFKFDFGQGKVEPGYLKVSPETLYTPQRGYGIDLGTAITGKGTNGKNALTDGFATSTQPFYFSVKVPEGNYHVKVTLGDDAGTSDAAIRAENRRMMVNRVRTIKGQHKTVEFTLHIRDSLIAGTNTQVRLKARERAYLHWDNKLTLEFNGVAPKINAIEITPAPPDIITLFLAGNSTVVDGAHEPYSAWGQMIPAFFQPGKVAVANYAESGESLSSFISARRFAKMLSLMKPGDYAFVEFGHNDQKQKGEGVGAFTTYKKNLQYFIAEVKKKGGIPVLVTSVQRRKFDAAGKIEETLGDYPAAVRETAKAENVALIDLNATSKIMFEAMGPEASLKAFAHYPANTFPGRPEVIADNTHFSPFGAYEIAKLILTGIRDSKLGLTKFIKPGEPIFDPSKPDAFNSFYWPNSPAANVVKPDGN
jgi:lysophospholipase L1-like esterase